MHRIVHSRSIDGRKACRACRRGDRHTQEPIDFDRSGDWRWTGNRFSGESRIRAIMTLQLDDSFGNLRAPSERDRCSRSDAWMLKRPVSARRRSIVAFWK
jgi:hypothetical protein